jgi:hypothetical protein
MVYHVFMTKTHQPARSATLSAFLGSLSAVPFLILNWITINRVQPFLSILRPTGRTSTGELVLVFLFLFFLPVVGALVAARPMLGTGQHGKRNFYLLNFIVVLVLLVSSVTLSVALGAEIYECDVLKIPNCD